MKESSWEDYFSSPRSVEQAATILTLTSGICYFIGALEFILGCLGFPGLFSGMAHIFLGYGLGRYRSRAAAIALFWEASGSFFIVMMTSPEAGMRNMAALTPSLLVAVCAVQATRAAFAYHSLIGSQIQTANLIRKGVAAVCYALFAYALVSIIVIFCGLPMDEEHVQALAVITCLPTLLTAAAALTGRLPLTKDRPFTTAAAQPLRR
ncbi:MAG: hypothetical protein NTY77_09715 [Elusimicrobia bacterium]|nr:hypothetical protein [Elusimicrobiota bacterium]